MRAGTSARSIPTRLRLRRAVDGRQRHKIWEVRSRTRRAKRGDTRDRGLLARRSPRGADSFINSVLERCRQLEQFPELGPVRHDGVPMLAASSTPGSTRPDTQEEDEEWRSWWTQLPDFIKPDYPLDIPPNRMPFVRYVFTAVGAPRFCPQPPVAGPGPARAATARPASAPTGRISRRSCSCGG